MSDEPEGAPPPRRRGALSPRAALALAAVAVVAGGVGLGIAIPLGTGGPNGEAERVFTQVPEGSTAQAGQGGAATPEPAGDALQLIDPPRPAPLTGGRDQSGAPVQIPSADGRPQLVTFLFTQCPDVCPLIATRIAGALRVAGPDARDVEVIAISVDPEDDTPRAVRAFLRQYGLEGRMRFLIGTRAELRPVWAAWQVAPQPVGEGHVHADGSLHVHTDDAAQPEAQPEAESESSVHSAPIVLVSSDGRRVARYAPGIPFETADLAARLAALR